MSDFEAWIGNCHLRETGDGGEYRCQAAVWARDYGDFHAIFSAHIEHLGYSILWLEKILPAPQYLSRHAGQHRLVGTLARAVHHGHRVEVGPMQDIAASDAAPEPESYLAIGEHRFDPLPDQTGIPLRDREWIASELKQRLFGQPEDGPTIGTYLLVDAGLRKSISKVFDLEPEIVDVPVQCLFKGEAANDLKEVAPYLLDMTLPKGAWDNRDLVPGFHRDLFAKHWGHNSGIFIRTTAFMEEAWNHFRKFTKVAMEEDGRSVFFLFYDPRVLPGYLRNIHENAGKVRCFCTSDAGEGYSFLIESGEDSVFEALPDMTRLSGIKRPRFSLSYSDFQPQAEAEKRKRALRIAERLKQDFA
ncbi:DUF4123 domain-containing protein [Thalassospira profundimaris]|uniref:DUF4123 domain-containing protein n=1 Tax=Thalassospira profundimaris TaxID=502049 RepID=UPI000DED56D5|nr:DUF4123 domain-containing protein [Thalassospira profundimaris]